MSRLFDSIEHFHAFMLTFSRKWKTFHEDKSDFWRLQGIKGSGGLRGVLTERQPGAPNPALCAHSLELLRWRKTSWFFGVWSDWYSLESEYFKV